MISSFGPSSPLFSSDCFGEAPSTFCSLAAAEGEVSLNWASSLLYSLSSWGSIGILWVSASFSNWSTSWSESDGAGPCIDAALMIFWARLFGYYASSCALSLDLLSRDLRIFSNYCVLWTIRGEAAVCLYFYMMPLLLKPKFGPTKPPPFVNFWGVGCFVDGLLKSILLWFPIAVEF